MQSTETRTNTTGVLCSGNLVYDTLVKPVHELTWGGTTMVDAIEYHAGGNGASTARALGILGVPVRLLGTVGDDDQGTFLLKRVQAAGVDITRIHRIALPTAATVAIVNPDGERKFFHRIGASAESLAHGIEFSPELCDGMAHYHMASLFVLPRLRPYAADVLAKARAAGLTTSFDTNWDVQGTWMRDLEPCLPHLDFLFMNEPEAEKITGSSDPRCAATCVLSRGVKTAVLKLGSRGCAICTHEQEIRCPAFDVIVQDTTGAGDCFVAGFLAAYLDNASLQDAGQFANAVGALTVQKIGAVNGVVSKKEAEEWMRTAKLRVYPPTTAS